MSECWAEKPESWCDDLLIKTASVVACQTKAFHCSLAPPTLAAQMPTDSDMANNKGFKSNSTQAKRIDQFGNAKYCASTDNPMDASIVLSQGEVRICNLETGYKCSPTAITEKRHECGNLMMASGQSRLFRQHMALMQRCS